MKYLLLSLLIFSLCGCSKECFNNKTEAVTNWCSRFELGGEISCAERLLANEKFEFNKCEK